MRCIKISKQVFLSLLRWLYLKIKSTSLLNPFLFNSFRSELKPTCLVLYIEFTKLLVLIGFLFCIKSRINRFPNDYLCSIKINKVFFLPKKKFINLIWLSLFLTHRSQTPLPLPHHCVDNFFFGFFRFFFWSYPIYLIIRFAGDTSPLHRPNDFLPLDIEQHWTWRWRYEGPF